MNNNISSKFKCRIGASDVLFNNSEILLMIAEAIISNMAVRISTSMAVIAIKKVGIRA